MRNTTIVLPTKGRHESLSRCLESILSDVEASANNHKVIVLDSSSRPEEIQQNQAAVGGLVAQTGAHISHVTPPQVGDYAELLSKTCLQAPAYSGLPGRAALINFSLIGTHTSYEALTLSGANRNMGLLLNAGTQYVSVDDDSRLSLYSLNAEQTDTNGSSVGSVSAAQFGDVLAASPIASLQDLDAATTPYRDSGIETLLNAVAASGTRNSPNNEHEHPRSRVRLASPGICGKRWYRRASYSLHAQGDFRTAAYRTKRSYRKAKLSGYAALQVPVYSVTDSPFFISNCYAADATEILPPFPPAGRSQDLIFAMLVKHMYPDNQIAHLPFMVRHDLGPARPFTEANFRVTGLDFGTITRLVIQHLIDTALPLQGEQALWRLGERLMELSTLPHAEWQHLTHKLYLGFVAGEIRELERLLEKHRGKPSYWAKDVHSHIELMRQAAGDTSNIIPTELKETHSPEEAGEVHRSFLHSYGELLCVWPELWQAAVALRESGWRPE